MKTQYAGKCKVCGITWVVGDEIYLQKEPKCVCKDKVCFDKQVSAGGQDKTPKPDGKLGFKVQPDRTDEQKLTDAIKMMELLWCPALKKATEIYPDPKVMTGPTTVANNPNDEDTTKNRMILAQVFYKSLVEDWVK